MSLLTIQSWPHTIPSVGITQAARSRCVDLVPPEPRRSVAVATTWPCHYITSPNRPLFVFALLCFVASSDPPLIQNVTRPLDKENKTSKNDDDDNNNKKPSRQKRLEILERSERWRKKEYIQKKKNKIRIETGGGAQHQKEAFIPLDKNTSTTTTKNRKILPISL